MAIDNSCSFRFMNSNLLNTTYITRSFSSEVTGNEFTNALDKNLSNTWKLEGFFEITTANSSITVNSTSGNVVVGTYTGATLATAIQTALNSISSGYTVTYTGVYDFTISRTSTFTLNTSTTTNAIWETIGFTDSSVDLSGLTSYTANEQRNHWPYEYVEIDFGFQTQIDFLALIYKTGEEFTLSNSATVTAKGSNVNDFDSPDLTVSATVSDFGAFAAFIGVDASYRYWRIEIYDPFRISGPNIEFSYLYFGQAEKFVATNISRGFTHSLQDTSTFSESESKIRYSDVGVKRNVFADLQATLLTPSNKAVIENLYRSVGNTEPFLISIDPSVQNSESIEDLTKFVFFLGAPTYKHVFSNIYSASFAFTETF